MLENLEPKPRKRTCRLRQVLKTLETTDQQILKDAIASPDWTTHGLLRALNDRGIEISYTSIRRHEQRYCSCGEAHYA